MQTFQLSTKLCFGDGALAALRELPIQRALLVTDPFFAENGTAARIAELCKGEVQVFSEVQPDPPLSLVARGVALLQDFKPDTLIALGGGSAIDCAKGMLSLGKDRPYFVAIPTTSGTGSEVTSFAILTHQGVKHPLVEAALRPDLAVLDDSLLQRLPKSLIADAGMDVVAHCVEAVAAKGASPLTQALAVSAYETVVKLLPVSYEGDSSVRGSIHCAATMAGIAFDQAGLGACHALSHALGGLFHIAHGKLNGILLPHVMEYNRDYAPYKLLGSNASFSITRLRRRLQLPQSLTEAGIKREAFLSKLDDLCAAALSDPCSHSNPRPVSKDAYESILRACL